MSEELFYTSVPRGLRPGTSGFCTVAATATLGSAWVQRLESLSGYKPLFPVGDAREAENPVSFAHTRVSVAGQTRSVLTRSCSSGFDHTGRSNKFSYHLVLSEQDRNLGGPAWMMRQPPTLRTAWDGGEPRSISSGRTLPTQRPAPTPANAWKQATGDAAWAARLAEIAVEDPAAIVYLIYPLGTDVLALFDESLRLLPEAQRWQVTFNTYLTEQPVGGSSCAWRAIVAESPAAAMARGNVIDLTRLAANTPAGPIADAARTGQTVVTVSLDRGAPADEEDRNPTPWPARSIPKTAKVSAVGIRLQSTTPSRQRPVVVPDNVNLDAVRRKSSTKLVLSIVLPIVGVVCVAVVVMVVVMTHRAKLPTPQIASSQPVLSPKVPATKPGKQALEENSLPSAENYSKMRGVVPPSILSGSKEDRENSIPSAERLPTQGVSNSSPPQVPSSTKNERPVTTHPATKETEHSNDEGTNKPSSNASTRPTPEISTPAVASTEPAGTPIVQPAASSNANEHVAKTDVQSVLVAATKDNGSFANAALWFVSSKQKLSFGPGQKLYLCTPFSGSNEGWKIKAKPNTRILSQDFSHPLPTLPNHQPIGDFSFTVNVENGEMLNSNFSQKLKELHDNPSYAQAPEFGREAIDNATNQVAKLGITVYAEGANSGYYKLKFTLADPPSEKKAMP